MMRHVVILLVFAAALTSAETLDGSRQLLVVTTPDWNAVHGTLQRYERTGPEQPWHKVGPVLAIGVGRNGMAWEGPQHEAGPVKQEGDGRSPAGVFSLGFVFGFAPSRESASQFRLPYRQLTYETQCVDDPRSRYYNRVVEASQVRKDWASAEPMRSIPDYRWGAVVELVMRPHPAGRGSCIFLHLGDVGPSFRGTAGCTALRDVDLLTVLQWLQPDAKPRLVQMPHEPYQRQRTLQDLP